MIKTYYCLLYSGMPIEGFSSNGGYPIFVSNDKYMPNYHFNSYEQAKDSMSLLLISSLGNENVQIDISKLSIGTVEIVVKTIQPVFGYDLAFSSILTNTYNTPAASEQLIGKIIHKCVRDGFKNILPTQHQYLLSDPKFVELIDKHVPFFVQQNIERFMDVGISACNEEEIAAIILTSSDELLAAIHIDSLNNVSK